MSSVWLSRARHLWFCVTFFFFINVNITTHYTRHYGSGHMPILRYAVEDPRTLISSSRTRIFSEGFVPPRPKAVSHQSGAARNLSSRGQSRAKQKAVARLPQGLQAALLKGSIVNLEEMQTHIPSMDISSMMVHVGVQRLTPGRTERAHHS